MIGIVLAGGTGSRLWPITLGVSKQLIPIYDKPLVHYPIGTLMMSGIKEIVIITTEEDQIGFKKLLGDGSMYGVKFHYKTQVKPEGIAQAFIIAEELIKGKKVCLILGDNLFHGTGLGRQLKRFKDIDGAQIFAYQVADPERYGVVNIDYSGKVVSIEEKPKLPKSKFAVPGLYFYDENVIEIAKNIRPSLRGELEISSVNQEYLERGNLKVEILPRGTAWLDTGTISSLYDAASLVKTLEERQGTKISCLEEIAFRNGWITLNDLKHLIEKYNDNSYSRYLRIITEESI